MLPCVKMCDWNDFDYQNKKPYNLLYGIWSRNNVTFQTMLWKAVAALDYVTVAKKNVTWRHIGEADAISVSGDAKNVTLPACVPDPFAFVGGNLSIMYINDAFNISCNDCTLSNCVNSTYSSFLIVKQPSFVFVPVNVSGSWYEDTGLAVLHEAEKHLLVRGKRFVGMLVAGIAAVITLIATATTATICSSFNCSDCRFC